MIQEAYLLASTKHERALYGAGEPYFNHVERVWRRVQAAGGDETTQVVALLHDTLEDTDLTLIEIADQFGDETAIAVFMISRLARGETYKEYIRRVGLSPIARFVKIQDLLENLSQNPPPHLKIRYETALAYLENVGKNPDSRFTE